MLQAAGAAEGLRTRRARSAGANSFICRPNAPKLAFADREKFYGDPKFNEIPIATLLSDAYNDERRKLISENASLDFVPGSVEGYGSV